MDVLRASLFNTFSMPHSDEHQRTHMHVREAISRFSSSSGKSKILKKADLKHSLLLNDCRIIASTATSGL